MSIDHLRIPYHIPIEDNDPTFPPEANVLMTKIANDIDIHLWYKKNLEQQINIRYKVLQEMELKINIYKTEIMVWNVYRKQ